MSDPNDDGRPLPSPSDHRSTTRDRLTPEQAEALRSYTTVDGYEAIQASSSGRSPMRPASLDPLKRERWRARLTEAQRLADELAGAQPPDGWYDNVYLPLILACWDEAVDRDERLALWELAEDVGARVAHTVGFGFRISDDLSFHVVERPEPE